MSFFKKIFKSQKESLSTDKEIEQKQSNLSIDDAFVHNFISKGGKFLYCTKIDEVIENINNILLENNWKKLYCNDIDLLKLIANLDITIEHNFNGAIPFFTTCEHLIANEGSLLFSSNQLGYNRLNEFSKHFIVYATTSQLVKNTGEGLTGIKTNFQGNIPTNISSVKNYSIKESSDDFLDYGISNSKNLYLLLFEDL
ncbi:MAG: hypothetical protein KGV59_02505 [Tenacibaculum sp.]|nr:hypothetical protein [Tenacibaculum sp.]